MNIADECVNGELGRIAYTQRIRQYSLAESLSSKGMPGEGSEMGLGPRFSNKKTTPAVPCTFGYGATCSHEIGEM